MMMTMTPSLSLSPGRGVDFFQVTPKSTSILHCSHGRAINLDTFAAHLLNYRDASLHVVRLAAQLEQRRVRERRCLHIVLTHQLNYAVDSSPIDA